MALATTPAWAGSWTVGLDYDGKCVSGSVTRPWAYDDENGSDQSAWTYGSNFSGSSSGKFILVLGWRPSSPGEKIPPSVTVRIQQTVRGSGGRKDMSVFPSPYNPAPGTPGSVTLSTQVTTPDGATFSDSAHEQKSGGGYNYSSLSQNPPVLVVVSTQGAVVQQGGSFLVRYPLPAVKGVFNVTPGTYVVETDPHVFDTYSDGCWAGATASVAFALDNREVYLTRGSLVPKIEGAPGVAIDKSRDEWREVDSSGSWTTHGQSRYSYQSLDPTDPVTLLYDTHTQVVTNAIGANKSGSWSSNLSATWSPGSNFDTTGSTRVDSPDGGAVLNNATVYDRPDLGTGLLQPGWYKTPSSGTGPTVTYNLTDNSSATPVTATAKYVFHLHDEWENPTSNTEVSRLDELGNKVEGETRREASPITFNVPPTTYTGTKGDPQVVEWTCFGLTTELSAELTTTFTSGADFKLKDWLNIGGKFEAKSSLKIDATSEYKSKGLLSLNPGEVAYPILRYFINTKHQLVDHYQVSGWDPTSARINGKWDQAADLPVEPRDIWPAWTVSKPGSTPQ